MFGLFSLPKLLFTIAIVIAVWYGFRWFQARSQVDDTSRGRKPVGGGKKTPDAPGAPGAEDMTECPVCGTYVVTAGARSCGKDGCPYRG